MIPETCTLRSATLLRTAATGGGQAHPMEPRSAWLGQVPPGGPAEWSNNSKDACANASTVLCFQRNLTLSMISARLIALQEDIVLKHLTLLRR
jgi:hypothetical protein